MCCFALVGLVVVVCFASTLKLMLHWSTGSVYIQDGRLFQKLLNFSRCALPSSSAFETRENSLIFCTAREFTRNSETILRTFIQNTPKISRYFRNYRISMSSLNTTYFARNPSQYLDNKLKQSIYEFYCYYNLFSSLHLSRSVIVIAVRRVPDLAFMKERCFTSELLRLISHL